MQTAFYAIALVVATYLWGYFFYKKDYHPQPISVIVQIFCMGLFAMIPIFGYKAIYQNYLPMLAEYEIFKPLLANPFLIGLTYFGFNLVMLYTVLFTLSGLLTLVLTFFKHETLQNIKRAIREESLDFIGVSMMIGVLIYIESFIQTSFGIRIVQTVLGTIP